MVIRGIGLHSVRGRQEDRGQYPYHLACGSAQQVPPLGCGPIQTPRQNMKPKSDQGPSRD